jgi:hypothetical protein
MNSLAIRHLKRAGSSAPGATVTARDSIDFVVDGSSLLDSLVKSGGGHGDFMGCFVRGFPIENERKKAQLTSAGEPDTEGGRYLLYLCPECGDIGCGAYGAKIRVTEETTEWYDFAYENGYEPARVLTSVGSFSFARRDYDATLEAATEV